MLIESENLVPLTEANQNFSRVARMVDERGSVVILRNNKPRYVLIDYDLLQGQMTVAPPEAQTPSEDEVLASGRKFLTKYAEAFAELAK
ncbi:prevent-host-death family protein [Xylanimonas cellulosilytica DSM 15894]|uniref:Antitoxin n=1 Tax=Xylanimonas cellulosilytica (strain DSM 15894 / JCM 12276 / CECT 5975 / KCTC 9989 / LMG 20990 / NBRC 107835 / XIL07) TaxID=446471 RepID=D1BUQ0_XYLCX|nr:type II toxin-antitoxin system Phd/YefM family antitoxin [Xylanimonas cellulosilytica]ACZ29291.1 prevent-host-death family protein [Xylanimonas cellulosilytica DSM 15894]